MTASTKTEREKINVTFKRVSVLLFDNSISLSPQFIRDRRHSSSLLVEFSLANRRFAQVARREFRKWRKTGEATFEFSQVADMPSP